jgi:hypothetical protein
MRVLVILVIIALLTHFCLAGTSFMTQRANARMGEDSKSEKVPISCTFGPQTLKLSSKFRETAVNTRSLTLSCSNDCSRSWISRCSIVRISVPSDKIQILRSFCGSTIASCSCRSVFDYVKSKWDLPSFDSIISGCRRTSSVATLEEEIEEEYEFE